MDDEYLARVEAVVTDVVSAMADEVDRDGRFPRPAIEALAEAGLLGLTSPADLGGAGGGLREAAEVVERVSQACGSTGMVLLMHYAAAGAIHAHGTEATRRAVATFRHLTTLAFSEVGSRSHFWVPMSTATEVGGQVRLDAQKSWVTAAGEADSYVWSSRPVRADGPMTLWLVPAATPGLEVAGRFDGLGLRGNASRPVRADGALVPATARLGEDGAGFDHAMQSVLPTFLVLNAAFNVGLMRAAMRETVVHLTGSRLAHLGQRLAEQPQVCSELGQLRIEVDRTAALLDDTLTAVADGREDATMRVLQIKAAAAETAIAVTDLAMKLCGGAAFRRELGIERRFRDARAARVMAPTTDRLYDFVGRLMCGMPLMEGA